MAASMDDSGETENASVSGAEQSHNIDKPVCIIILGMAGSGKTTFVQVNLTVTHNTDIF